MPFPALVAVLLSVAIAVVAFRAGLSSPSSDRGASPRASGPSPSLHLQPLPACRLGSKPAARVGYRAWRVTLVDTTFRLPKTYAPPGLVSTVAAGFEAGFLIRKVVVPDLAALREAAEAAGDPIAIVASYRSYQQQGDQPAEAVVRPAPMAGRPARGRVEQPAHRDGPMGLDGSSVMFRALIVGDRSPEGPPIHEEHPPKPPEALRSPHDECS